MFSSRYCRPCMSLSVTTNCTVHGPRKKMKWAAQLGPPHKLRKHLSGSKEKKQQKCTFVSIVRNCTVIYPACSVCFSAERQQTSCEPRRALLCAAFGRPSRMRMRSSPITNRSHVYRLLTLSIVKPCISAHFSQLYSVSASQTAHTLAEVLACCALACRTPHTRQVAQYDHHKELDVSHVHRPIVYRESPECTAATEHSHFDESGVSCGYTRDAYHAAALVHPNG